MQETENIPAGKVRLKDGRIVDRSKIVFIPQVSTSDPSVCRTLDGTVDLLRQRRNGQERKE